jgi:drug/metabolite transporter (DMT)-like permease
MNDQPHAILSDAWWYLIALSGLGFVVAAFNYAQPGNGIAYTPGALLVLVSSLLILAASIVVHGVRHGIPWLNTTLNVLIALGLIGTAFAAYMLDAFVLTGLMLLALCAEAASLMRPAPSPATLANREETP